MNVNEWEVDEFVKDVYETGQAWGPRSDPSEGAKIAFLEFFEFVTDDDIENALAVHEFFEAMSRLIRDGYWDVRDPHLPLYCLKMSMLLDTPKTIAQIKESFRVISLVTKYELPDGIARFWATEFPNEAILQFLMSMQRILWL